MRSVVILVCVAGIVFLIGSWLTAIGIKSAPLLITQMKDVSYLTTKTLERQFLINIPLKNGGHFTEMTTTKIKAGVELRDIHVASNPNHPLNITLPAARVLNSPQEVSASIRGKGVAVNENIVNGYSKFAQRWTTRMDTAGSSRFLPDARNAAKEYIEKLYGRAGLKVEFADPPVQEPSALGLRQIEGVLGNFLLDADFAAQLNHCPDLAGDCFELGDKLSRLKVKVFSTEHVESGDSRLSRLFDQSNPGHVITSAYLKANSFVFFRWDVGHTVLYAITIEAADEARLGDVLPIALEMAFTFSPKPLPKDHCLSAGGVTLDQWNDLSRSMKRATWRDDVDAFGAIWSHVSAKTGFDEKNLADDRIPLDGTVGTVQFVPELDRDYAYPVAVDQSGLNEAKEHKDRFEKLVGLELGDAVSVASNILLPDVMLTILDRGWVHRDRMLVITEKTVVTYVPSGNWLERKVVKTFPINFKLVVDGTKVNFGSRIGFMPLDYLLPGIELRSVDLVRLLTWLSTDYSPLGLARCVWHQQSAQRQ